MRPLILDTYCGGGGAGKGFHDAGFDVVGVDINPMPNYPYGFIQADTIKLLTRLIFGETITDSRGRSFTLDDIAGIHASPPCQAYTIMQHIHHNNAAHPDLVEPTRVLLKATGKPYVIENVEGAPLRVDLMLCGTMFGIRFPKHRWFEVNFPINVLLPPCNHYNVYDCFHGGEDARQEREKLSELYGIDWFMTRQEIRNCIPPAYTEFIGRQLMTVLQFPEGEK